ncbi:MAG: hypothetical protein JKY89_03280 [Immundisolibacteraceae bacterium]|nr:hypothetical protein [Immundisolibacteraceae bacterium]
MLCRLLQNLISNALKYRRPDVTPMIEIRSDLLAEQGFCTISVKDNRVDFNQAQVNQIFEPFNPLVTANEFEGQGIATANKIIKLHGGANSACGTLDQGAVFQYPCHWQPS